MRAGSIVSSTITLFALQVHGAPERKLEALTEGDTLAQLEQFFGTKFERKFTNLPTSHKLKPEPWNGPMWPKYSDGINYMWNPDQPSPTEKYAMAFGLDANALKATVSAKFGIYSVDNSAIQCSWSCPDQNDVCTTRNTSNVCISRWDGISHTNAAIFEKEPLCSITFNDVEFHPNDIKGLISAVYAEAGLPTIGGGNGYYGGEVSFDQYGRPTDASYRDLTPAFYHLAVSNILGNLHQSFIIDQYPNRAVWLQALSGFEIDERVKMTPKEAANTFYKTDSYPFNNEATQIIQVTSTVFWNNKLVPFVQSRPLLQNNDPSASYKYLLELNDAGEIIGGEWLEKSIQNHPDFMYVETKKPADDLVTSTGFSYANVLKLIDMATACDGASTNAI